MLASQRRLRWLFYGTIAAFEASLAFTIMQLLGTFLPNNPARWWVLLAVVLVGAAASMRWANVGPGFVERLPMTLFMIGIVLWATKIQVGGGLVPWTGWERFRQLVQRGESELGYFALLASLWSWWRGLSLLERDHGTLINLLRRSVVGLSIGGSLLAVIGGLSGDQIRHQETLLLAVVSLLGFGFLSLMMARVVADADAAVVASRSRWIRNGVAVTLAILTLGVAILALFADPAANVLRDALVWCVYALSVVLAPVMWLLYQFFDGILRFWFWIFGTASPTPAPDQGTPLNPNDFMPNPDTMSDMVGQLPVAIVAAVPLLILIAAILLFTRRQSKLITRSDEEHESLFSWNAVGADLRNLFQRRTLDGLQAALRALSGSDPASRIRRRYVQTMLAAAADHPRAPHQTPAEYRPHLDAALPQHKPAVQNLTDLYQKARYAPEQTTAADAQAADSAWQDLEP